MNKLQVVKSTKVLRIVDIGIIALIFAIIIFAFYFSNFGKPKYIKIYSNNILFGEYELNADRDIIINNDNGYNLVRIKDGKVAVIDSSCLNKICIHTGYTNMVNSVIVCAPNRLIIIVCGSDGDNYDYAE
jgi:hypothetical protein